jgi:hypothetical protein
MTEHTIPNPVEDVGRSAPSLLPESAGAPPEVSERGWRRHPDLPSLVLGLILAVGVCWPFVGGRVFLLDWVIGPHASVLPPSFFGLNGGVTAGMPLAVAMGVASHFLGSAATWLPIVAFFPIATTAMSRLVGGSLWARLGAGTLYAVNPFVFQRLYAGQIALLLGYALLPFVVRSMVRAVDARGPARLTPVLWMALLTGMSPHFAWICAVVLVAVVVCHRRRLAALAWAAIVELFFVASLAYVFLPTIGTSLPVTVGTRSLAAFQTSGDPHIGIFGNVVGLYGFWRVNPGPVLPKDVVSGWLFFLGAIVVVVVGAASTLQGKSTALEAGSGLRYQGGSPSCWLDRRAITKVVIVAAVLGFFLALGSQGPTGPLFRWAFDHVPFFDVMREPEKFSMLLGLGYATCFGLGVERLVSAASGRRGLLGRIGVAALAVGLPLAYTPTIFDGLEGQIAPSNLPASWDRTQTITAHRSGTMLFLPWEEYLSFPFTGGRAIANPAPTAFDGEVISGTNVQLEGLLTDSTSPRSAYIERVLAEHGAAGPMGSLMAPLGVQYVALAKTVDWRNYRWLSAQPTLRLVLDSPGLELWENLAYTGIGHRGSATVPRISPVAYRIPPGKPGRVTVAIPYQSGWSLNGSPARPTGEGVVSVWAGTAGGVLRFEPWRLVVVGDAISLALLVGLAIVCAVSRSATARRRPDDTQTKRAEIPLTAPK